MPTLENGSLPVLFLHNLCLFLTKNHWQTVHLKRFTNVIEECFASTHFTKIKTVCEKKHWLTVNLKRFANVIEECFANTHFIKIKTDCRKTLANIF